LSIIKILLSLLTFLFLLLLQEFELFLLLGKSRIGHLFEKLSLDVSWCLLFLKTPATMFTAHSQGAAYEWEGGI
jgi:hypothetical protein